MMDIGTDPASFHTADDLFDVDSIPGVGGEVALPAVLIVASGVRRGGSHRIRCRRRKQSLALELVELSLRQRTLQKGNGERRDPLP